MSLLEAIGLGLYILSRGVISSDDGLDLRLVSSICRLYRVSVGSRSHGHICALIPYHQSEVAKRTCQ
jgi:hypothetical protein